MIKLQRINNFPDLQCVGMGACATAPLFLHSLLFLFRERNRDEITEIIPLEDGIAQLENRIRKKY